MSGFQLPGDIEGEPIPPLAGHAMILMDGMKIWILGGIALSGYFSEHDFIYDTAANRWSLLEVSGSKPTGMHSRNIITTWEIRLPYKMRLLCCNTN